MSLGRCIPQLVDDGSITPERAGKVMALYDELLAGYRETMGEAAAEAAATTKAVEQLAIEAAQRKRQTLLQVAAQRRMVKDLETFKKRGKDGEVHPEAAVALFDHDERAPYSNVEARRKVIRGRAHAMMDEVLARHHTDVTGRVRAKAGLREIVRELFGEDTGIAAAKELAQAWERTAEMLRTRFNAAGGHVGKMERWGLPQSHDSRAVRKAGFEAWRDEIAPRLDRERMIDEATGQPFTPQRFQVALRQVWETIRSEGWNTREAGTFAGGKLANRHADSRFLIFKSADDWMDYQERFGAGSAFDSMMGHIDYMARDTAMMEILGPNPKASVQWLKDNLTKSAALIEAPDSKATDRAYKAGRQIDRLYAEITGAANRPENRTLALAFSALRSMQTAAKLGGATLSALTDVGFQSSTRYYNGLKQATIIRDYLKLMRPFSKSDQRLAVRQGLIAEEWSRQASAQNRYLNEELTGEVSRRLAEGVLRVSGLSRWTQAGRWAFGMEFLGMITAQSVKTFDKLEPGFARALQRYGIGPGEWEVVRRTPLEKDGGTHWLKPANVEDAELGDRLMEMIATETDYAVPTADLRTRALMHSVAPSGTLIGETIKSGFLFKSFGISMIIMQGRRMMQQSAGDAARYAAGMVISTTLMAALVIQLKALFAGQDVKPMDDADFWAAAAFQGGGFGIFGDFVKASESRVGGGLAQTAAGPLVGSVDNAVKAAKGSTTQKIKFVKAELPGQSLWYTRLAFDRLIADQIQREIDPDHADAWRRMARYAKEQRTKYWWKPGDTEPRRAPSFDAYAGDDSR